MKDQSIEGQNQKAFLERLEAVAFHLTQLYHRLSQDFDRWAVTGGDLAEMTETFNKEVAKFATLDQEVKRQLEHSIKGGAEQVSASFAGVLEQTVKSVLTREIISSANGFLRTTQKIEQTLEDYEQQIRYRKRWDVILYLTCTLIGGLVSGVTVYYLFR